MALFHPCRAREFRVSMKCFGMFRAVAMGTESRSGDVEGRKNAPIQFLEARIG